MWNDFKAFIMKGNVLELAIAVVMGAAFGKIVSSLVDNIITPILGIITGGVDFSKSLIYKYGEAEIMFGVFIQSIIDFIFIAFAIFMFMRIISKLQRKKEVEVAAEPEVDSKEELLTEIRDLLKKQA